MFDPKIKVYYTATCPTCTRASDLPYRVYDERGNVLQGCIDEFHTGHLVTPSASASWHHRPDAKRIRSVRKASRDGYVSRDIRYIIRPGTPDASFWCACDPQ